MSYNALPTKVMRHHIYKAKNVLQVKRHICERWLKYASKEEL